jgi:hypothetical protein
VNESVGTLGKEWRFHNPRAEGCFPGRSLEEAADSWGALILFWLHLQQRVSDEAEEAYDRYTWLPTGLFLFAEMPLCLTAETGSAGRARAAAG